jgi:hypothetical protein
LIEHFKLFNFHVELFDDLPQTIWSQVGQQIVVINSEVLEFQSTIDVHKRVKICIVVQQSFCQFNLEGLDVTTNVVESFAGLTDCDETGLCENQFENLGWKLKNVLL